jgi:hypothetical protein
LQLQLDYYFVSEHSFDLILLIFHRTSLVNLTWNKPKGLHTQDILMVKIIELFGRKREHLK